MATKVSRKEKTTVSKAGSGSTIDPFASQVEPTAATEAKPKRAIRVTKAATPQAKAAVTAPVRSRAKKAAAIEPFAEIATVSSPTKVANDVLESSASPKKRTNRKAAVPVSKPGVEVVAAASPAKSEKKTAKKSSKTKVAPTLDVTAEIAATEPEVELSPAFKALADVKLPELDRENRARLQMQSPTRLYFYWSLRQNPWQQLRAVFGPDLGSYALVVTLKNLTAGTEEITPAEAEGEWWFDVDPDAEYQAEIGFYAVNRPYFRVLYSNNVTIPRRSPSPHPASEARWTVSATKFAEVLDASGFSRDAVDVAIAGDDHLSAEHTTKVAFSQMMGDAEYSTRGIAAEDLRYTMLALAGGTTIEDLRSRVSASLFATLQSNAGKLSAESAREVLTTHFDVDETEWNEEEVLGSAVYGASLINFPKTLKARRDATYSPRYNPVSSYSLGR